MSNLGKVIYELSENSKAEGSKKQPSFINFRQSKLTHLLKDSLGGNSKTLMICTLNPHISAIREALSTVKFAQRAKMIRNKAIVNEENSDAEYWKQKYLALLKNGAPSPNTSEQVSRNTKGDTMVVDEGSLRNTDLREENLSPSWNSVLTKQLKEQASMLRESHSQMKQLI